MNQYLLLRRMRGPLIIVTIGVMALLDQYGVLNFGQSWPLILIVIGVLQLAEHAVLAQLPPPPPGGFYPDGCGIPMPGAGNPTSATGHANGEFATPSREERKY